MIRNPDGLEIVEISGTVRLARDCGKVRKVLADTRARWGQTVVDNVSYQPDVQKIKDTILATLVSARVEKPDVDVAADLSRIVLAGTVYTEEQAAETLRLAGAQAAKLELHDVTFVSGLQRATTTFEVEVTQFEISDNQARAIGKDLFNQIVSGGTYAEGIATYGTDKKPNYQVVAKVNVDGILNLLEAKGAATRLTRFTVLTQNGQEGRGIHADEYIIPVYREQGASPSGIERVDAGLIIKAMVTIRNPTNVLLKIDCEVSDSSRNMFFSNGQNYPILGKRQFVNTVEVPLNSQMILGAAEAKLVGKSERGTPWLRHVPIVNWFFGEDNQDSTAVYAGLLVTVRQMGAVVSEDPSVSARTEEIAKQVRERFEQAQ